MNTEKVDVSELKEKWPETKCVLTWQQSKAKCKKFKGQSPTSSLKAT